MISERVSPFPEANQHTTKARMVPTTGGSAVYWYAWVVIRSG